MCADWDGSGGRGSGDIRDCNRGSIRWEGFGGALWTGSHCIACFASCRCSLFDVVCYHSTIRCINIHHLCAFPCLTKWLVEVVGLLYPSTCLRC